MIRRRRFLTIAAAALAAPSAALAAPAEWRGRALGAEARIVLAGASAARARRTFAAVERTLATIEGHFSLHRESSLTRLNRDGRLAWPGDEVTGLLTLAGRIHGATGGAFDPSIQPLWLAEATGGDAAAARALTGWQGVRIGREEVRLARPGMALTLNGIAQGWAADRIAGLLAAAGFGDVLVDMGEIVARGARPGGGPWRAAIALPDETEVARLSLANRALATSSPAGTRIGPDGRRPHILDPRGGAPRWRLAAVSARSAGVADALSTAFCVMTRAEITRALAAFPDAVLAALV